MNITTIDTPIGPFTIRADDELLTSAGFDDTAQPGGPDSPVAAAVRAYFDGDLDALDPFLEAGSAGSEHQRRVWRALCAIPRGTTRSYAAVAAGLGSGARVVGTACARNPVALIVPCHRVVRADGSLGGYRYGLERKRWLLEHERRA